MKIATLLLTFAAGIALLSAPPAEAKKYRKHYDTHANQSVRPTLAGTKCFWVYNGSPSGPGRWCSCGLGNCGG